MNQCNCPKDESYDIVSENAFDLNTMRPKTVKSVIVDANKPLFQKDGISYADEAFRAYMKYSEIKPKNLKEVIFCLSEIEKEFIFDVFDWKDVTFDSHLESRVIMSLGSLKCERRLKHSYNENLTYIKFSNIFDTFLELLSSYCDLVGDKPTIVRKKYDNEFRNKILLEYAERRTKGLYNTGAVVLAPKLPLVPEPPAPPPSRKIGGKVNRKPIEKKLNKPKHKYGLDSMNLSDDVYKEVTEYIESLEDFIHVDYNNMYEI